LAAAPAAGCAAAGVREEYLPPQGLETPSESVMLSMTDVGAGVHFTARLCRYPAHGVAWLWTHVQTPDGFFEFVDHAAACGGDATPEGVRVSYADAAGVLTFARDGATETPQRATLAARVSLGTGGSLAGDFSFTPTLMRAGLLPGRVEAFGAVEGELRINGRTMQLRGNGQFHEQRQTEARFTTPFAFATLWGEDVGVTMLQIPGDSGGYILRTGQAARPGRVQFSTPGEPRLLRIDFGPDDFLEGRAIAVRRYTISLYGQAWRGAFVTAELGGHVLHGSVNDWRPDLLFAS
jgi:hypothetical protein